MAAFICARCSHVVESADGSAVRCPNCGNTCSIDDDSTRTFSPANSTVTILASAEPRKIGRYLIERELGHGGFGIVYLAYDPDLGRQVAIKVPRQRKRENGESLERFAREARSAAQLRHPGIVTVFDVQYDGPDPFIVCEFVEGQTLHDRLRKDPPYTFTETAQFVEALAEAVQYAHENRVIHRDIKPANVMITPKGAPRLMDFGMAKLESPAESLLTGDHRVLGTPAYMSPEQASGRRDAIDRRTDIYSLGVVLYQLLTRELPFRGEPRMVLRQVLEEEPRPPRSLNGDIPLDLDTICLKAMEKETSQRYQTAGELAAELRRWLRHEPIHARPISRWERGRRWCRRNPVIAGLVATIVFGSTVAACVGVALAASEQRQKNAALLAKREEHDARVRVEELLVENRGLLSKAYIERANHYLEPKAGSSEYAPIKALPWQLAAAELDEANSERRNASRIRLASALTFLPKVERVWAHPGRVGVARFSRSGNRLITGGEDGNIRLSDVRKGQAVGPIFAHPVAINDATFSPDGKLLLTSCIDGTVRLWDTAAGKLVYAPTVDLRALQQLMPIRPGCRVGFSNAGGYFVFAVDSVARIYETSTGRPVGKPIGMSSRIVGADFVAEDHLLALSSWDGSVEIWDVQSGIRKQQLAVRSTRANAMVPAVLSPDGTGVAWSEDPASIAFWDSVSRKKSKGNSLGRDQAVTVLCYSPDAHFLAAGTSDGSVFLLSTVNGHVVWKQRIGAEPIEYLRFGASGSLILAASEMHEPQTYLLETESGRLASEPVNFRSQLQAIEVLAPRNAVATVTADGLIRVWNLGSEEHAFLLPGASSIRCAGVPETGTLVASIDRRRNCHVLPMNGELPPDPTGVKVFPAQTKNAVAVAVSSDQSKLAIADVTFVVSIFDLKKNNELLARCDHGAAIVQVAFAHDGGSLITVSKDGKLTFWNVASGEPIVRLESMGQVNAAHIEPSQSRCALAGGKEVLIWDLSQRRRIGPILAHDSNVFTCKLSPDGRSVACGCEDGVGRLWDVATGKLLASTPRGSRPVRCIDLSADGRQIAAGSEDGGVWVSKLIDGKAAFVSLVSGQPVAACLFHPNSRFLVTLGDSIDSATKQSVVRGWDTLTGEQLFVRSISRLCGRFPLPRGAGKEPWVVSSAFFSPRGDWLHLLTAGATFVSISLDPFAAKPTDFVHEVAVRAGALVNTHGNSLLLDPNEIIQHGSLSPQNAQQLP